MTLIEIIVRKAANLVDQGEHSGTAYRLVMNEHIPPMEDKLNRALKALEAMCEEYRQLDLPYGSTAYMEANKILQEKK